MCAAPAVLSRLPAVMRPDDHEIDDNWEPDPPGANPHGGRAWKDQGDAESRSSFATSATASRTPSVEAKLWHQTPIARVRILLGRCADGRALPHRKHRRHVPACSAKTKPRTLDKWLADKSVAGTALLGFRVHGPSAPPQFRAPAPFDMPPFGRMGRLSGIAPSFAGQASLSAEGRCRLPVGGRACLQRRPHRDQQA